MYIQYICMGPPYIYFIDYPPSGNRAGKLLELPPRIQGTSSTTPLETGPENSFKYPPSNSGNFIDYPPPSKFGRKTPSTTPLEFRELHRLPPLKIGPENSFNYPPPSNSRNFIDYPPRNISNSPPPPNSIPRSATGIL